MKAIDSYQKAIINFAKELVKKRHKVTIYNNTSKNQNVDGINWRKLSELPSILDETDILIVCNDVNLLNIEINSKLKFFWLNSTINSQDFKNILIALIKGKFIILYTSDFLISSLPDNFKYIPKIKIKIGISDIFCRRKV